MIVSFRDGAAEDLFNGVNSKRARKACPRSLWVVASRKLDQLDSVLLLDELKVPPGNRLEALSGNGHGQYSTGWLCGLTTPTVLYTYGSLVHMHNMICDVQSI